MVKPNFFLIGAPRSGTTSLARYLQEHENVFMCKPKEPNFFGSHQRGPIKTLDQYREIFEPAEKIDNLIAIGEATANYFGDLTALRKIDEFQPDARILVILRNPAEVVFSMHGLYVQLGHESELNFEKAWQIAEENEPKLQAQMPDKPFAQIYADHAMHGRNLEEVYAVFPKDRVHWILFDDFKADTAGEYRKVQEFLGLPVRDLPDTKVHNESFSFTPGSGGARKAVSLLWNFSKKITARMGIYDTGLRERALRVLRKLGLVSNKSPQMSPETRAMLRDYFRSDILRLQDIIGRDLSAWLK